MNRRLGPLMCAWAVLSLGCAFGGGTDLDGGPAVGMDAGRMDSGTSFDAGMPLVDAGPGSDAELPPLSDAGPPGADAGPPGADAGPPGADAGPPRVDAGPPGFDAGPPRVDAGPPGFDAGPPAVDAGEMEICGIPPLPCCAGDVCIIGSCSIIGFCLP